LLAALGWAWPWGMKRGKPPICTALALADRTTHHGLTNSA